MTTKEKLNAIAAEIRAISPSVGRVHQTLKARITMDDVKTDFEVKDTDFGDILKGWVVRPGDGDEERSTISQAFSESSQNFVISGMISVVERKATEDVLEDEMNRVRNALRQKTARLESGQNAFITGAMSWTAIGLATMGEHQVYTKNLTITVQDREAGT